MMQEYRIVEKFVSIDGEGPTAGALSVFIRFAGCNLRCNWCDTTYAQANNSHTETLSAEALAAYVHSTGVKHITLTGGEPLLQPGITALLARLTDYQIHIETNGSLAIEPFRLGNNIHFVVDYKLPGSGMENKMLLANLAAVRSDDAYKLVMANTHDLEKAFALIKQYRLNERTQVFLSCVFDQLAPAQVVEALKANPMEGVRLQLQMHKYIWNKNQRGV